MITLQILFNILIAFVVMHRNFHSRKQDELIQEMYKALKAIADLETTKLRIFRH